MLNDQQRALLSEIARQHEAPVELVESLLSLEAEFSNLTQPNARRMLQERVAELVSAAMPKVPETAAG